MALSSEHIPFTRSLSERVHELYEPMELEAEATLERSDLIAFLAKAKESDESPLVTIERRAAKANREAVLSHADSAILAWVTKVFEEWEQRFPVEAPIRDQLHRLLPLTAAMALRDESFLTPGVHPLHQLLDTLQHSAVGWQVRLERAGQMLEQRIGRSVEKALEWFNDETLDLTLITRELVAANERDDARAQRMVQRLAETEEAHLRTLSAKHDAALFINEGLDEYELPAAIGEFLKGPWYDSAQLVLVKHGPDSEQWSQMQRATRHLMQSVQDPSARDDSQRDRREQMLRHLPGELRRWLLSLEHDSDATDSAIGLVEYAHLRLQHGQQLQRDRIERLPVEEAHETDVAEAVDESRTGDWYRFEDEEGELRGQLALELEGGQHLIFTNFVGLKAIDLPRKTFIQRCEDGFARHLPDVATFSISLARAVRIRNDDDYRLFLDPTAVPTEAPTEPPTEAPVRREATDDGLESARGIDGKTLTDSHTSDIENLDLDTEPESKPEGAAAPDDKNGRREVDTAESEASIQDLESLDLEFTDGDAMQEIAGGEAETPAEESALEPATSDVASAGQAAGSDPVLDPPPEAETELTLEPMASEGGPGQAEPFAQGVDPAPNQSAQAAPGAAPMQPPPGQTPPSTYDPQIVGQPGAQPPPQQPGHAPAQQPGYAPAPPQPAQYPPQYAGAPEAHPAGHPLATQVPPPPGYAPNHPQDYPPNQPPNYQPPPGPGGGFPPHAQPPVPQVAPGYEQFNPNYPPPPALREVDVPMGAWLGFHDGEAPLMAKLAVYDPRRDNYIFVNRKGIALRELSRAQLLSLMDRGLVDILETRSYFREEVERAREEQP